MTDKHAITRVPVHDIIAQRRSGRAFDERKPVSREHIITLLEAARWAPSCFGDEPWRFIVWDKNTDAAAWQKAFSCLGEPNQRWAKNAPVLLLSIASSLFRESGKPNRWSQYDVGAAAENLSLQATALGLMAHQMGGFDADRARLTFNIPAQYECMAMIAVGYTAAPETLTEDMKLRELAQRKRRPLQECFFENIWEEPVKLN